MNRAQRKLKEKHGTPYEFQMAVFNCVDISYDEATRASNEYNKEWLMAGLVDDPLEDIADLVDEACK